MIDWLTDTLIATSLLMVLVLLVREPVRRRFGPAAAYGLWLVPALRLVMPPVTWTVERAAPSSTPLSFDPGQTIQAAILPASSGLAQQFGGLETLAVSVWLIGAAAMLIVGLLIYRTQRREVLRDSTQLAQLGSIRIVQSPAVRGPVAFGLFDRVIALPIDFDDRYDPNERRLAFEHELSHHQSGDLVANHFAFLVLCLQWFNPLAWLSHTAFRFDQEAACDARVLARACKRNRAAYAQAIAKAASGRALLFAGALDRPGTLQKRLRSMLADPGNGRKTGGKVLVALTAATALPLTASWATRYVDVEPAPVAPQVASAKAKKPSAAPAALGAASAAATAEPESANAAASKADYRENADGTVTLRGGVTLGKGSTAFFGDDKVLINGKVKRFEQLTAAERTKLRKTLHEAQRELAQQRADLPRELAELKRDADWARSGELKRELLRDREDLRRDLVEIESEAAELRANGKNPEKLKAEILKALRKAEATDIDKEIREAIEAADPKRRLAELERDERQAARMLARLDQLDRR